MTAVSPEEAFFSPDQLVAALRGLCAERRTGTLFVITGDNQTARFVLRQGEIVAAQFRVRRGLDALLHMRHVTSGRFNFTPDVAGPADAPALPPNHEILAILARQEIAPGRETPLAREPPPSRPQLERAQRVLEAELTEYLGPMARIICREHLLRAGDLAEPGDLARVVDAISKEIGDPAKEARFKREALAKLRE